jgi:hypothetical protein
MPLDVPNLDDRRWTDLVDEGRELIPRFAPGWTDHNPHDPGITFIELFAWLVEMQIYQVNRVSDRHREAFARLAGVRRCRRTPARVILQIDGQPRDSIVIPEGEQLTTLEGEGLVFETDAPVQLTRSRLQVVTVDDGEAPIDQTEANRKAGIAFLAFGERARQGASLILGFDEFYPRTEPRLRITFDVVTEDLLAGCGADKPSGRDCGEKVTAGAAQVDLIWEYLGQSGRWSPLTPVSDETAGLVHSGTLTMPTPPAAARRDRHVWIRCRIARGYYDVEPRLRRVSLNALPCSQRQTFHEEALPLLEGRAGRPDQVFELAHGPVLLPDGDTTEPVIIRVGKDEWQRVESFDASGPGCPHFVFDPERRRVMFGNGLNGRVPVPGQPVVAVRYQTSAGPKGNVAKELRWAFRSGGVAGITLTNPAPAIGGAEQEPLDDLELRTQALLRRAKRGVTLRDLERLALEAPHAYVARAKAIPNCPTPESITVVAVPKKRPGRTGPPQPPSDAFLDTVRRHLQRHRLLCDNLRVTGPAYIEVRVSARLRLVERAGPDAVLLRAREALDAFLAGAGDPADRQPAAEDRTASPCPSRWPFGRDVFPSEVYAVLDRVQGIDSVSDLALSASRGSSRVDPLASGAIPVPPTGLVFAGPHDLSLTAASAGSKR